MQEPRKVQWRRPAWRCRKMTPTPRCAGDGSSGSPRAPCPTEFLVQTRPTQLAMATTTAAPIRCALSPPTFPLHSTTGTCSRARGSSRLLVYLSLSLLPTQVIVSPFPRCPSTLPVTPASRRLLRTQNQLSVRTSTPLRFPGCSRHHQCADQKSSPFSKSRPRPPCPCGRLNGGVFTDVPLTL